MSGNSWITIGVCATALAAFAIPYGFHLKSKMKSQADINITGDVVLGNKTVNIQPSIAELENIVRKAMEDSKPELTKYFDNEFIAAGISRKSFIVPKGHVPSIFNVRWETGRVIEITNDMITIIFPDLEVKPKHSLGFIFSRNTISLPRQLGAGLTLVNTGEIEIKTEIIGIDKDIVTIGVGLIKKEN